MAKAGKPHIIVETFILPEGLDLTKIIFGKQDFEKLKSILLTDNTIQHRISNMGTDVRNQVTEKIKNSSFVSFQFDECLRWAQFVAFVF